MRANPQTTLIIAVFCALQLLGIQSQAQSTPPIPTTNLLAWFKQDAGVVADPTQPNNITSWQDQSGNGSNVTQTTKSQEPAIGSSGITFNGSQWLNFPSGLMSSLTTQCTLFLVETYTAANVPINGAAGTPSYPPIQMAAATQLHTSNGYLVLPDIIGSTEIANQN